MNTIQILDKIDQKESFLLAGDGIFLGKLTLNKYDSESIFNEYGLYGSKYSTTSIYNKFGTYGSIHSLLSPFNKYAQQPPFIYLHGIKFGFLTKNIHYNSKTIDPDTIFEWLQKVL